MCTLASIALPKFVRDRETFDFDELHAITKQVVRNTNRLLDVAAYPSELCSTSNNNTRSIGVGVQGLADTFMALKMPYDSEAARNFNIEVFETIYHAALEASSELAKEQGPYPAWVGSPASLGTLQVDMWPPTTPRRFDFSSIRSAVDRKSVV